MFTTNPFTPLTDFMSPGVMQGYIVLMVLAVAIGTVFDLLRDKKLTFAAGKGCREAATQRRG
jgi:hypothetical protein